MRLTSQHEVETVFFAPHARPEGVNAITGGMLMWKKDETPIPSPAPQPERSPTPAPSAAPSPVASGPAASSAPAAPAARQTPSQRAAIGRSISIRGDVTGDEDLLIQGRVEGSIDLKNHAVTIGSEGEVKASVTGRVVVVEGSVEGNISSEEQVILRASARVQGDITAPRVVLEDGARFRGGVDMGDLPEFDVSGKKDERKEERGKQSATPPAASSNAPNDKAAAADSKGDKAASDGGGKKKESPELFAEARA